MLETAAERRPSLLLLPGIVDRPRQTLAQVLAYPSWRWVLPMIVIGLTLVVLTVIAAPALSEQARAQQTLALQRAGAQLSNLTEAQRAQMEQQVERLTTPLLVGGMSLLTGIIGLGLNWFIGAGILYFGLQLSGRDLKFAQVLAGISWTWLPFGLRNLLYAGWTLATGQLVANPGLSYFFSTGDPMADARNPWWNLASHVDLFAIWHVLLVFFLLRVAHRRSSGIGLTLVYALLMLAARVVPTVLLTSLSLGG